ncbi:MAG TPA: hypothetical protein VL485_20505 [Ktedonobacteraceae bacterium]|jgi:hypothetical protein|nr:hypothetical protein [Ktedonobacteraceae bacterium]
MDSSLKSAHLAVDELDTTLTTEHEGAEGEHEEPHIHLPNPSLWPALLSVAILIAVAGLLFVPETPWLTIVGVVLVLVGILGWGLENPMAAPKARYVTIPNPYRTPFSIGQRVLDKDGELLGTVQARFKHYVLVEQGDVFVQAFYVPHSVINQTSSEQLRLTVSQEDLLKRGLNVVPDDLYEEQPEPERFATTGVPMFASGPLSPAETGHYNYGPNYPGINTDASGSYLREEVSPKPYRYVGERRKVYAGEKALPPRVATSN